jgi:pilus assembly protein Flp/PilA
MEMLKRFWNDEEGQGMVEYGLIIALIAVVVVVALGPLGEQIATLFTGVKDDLVHTP